MSVELTDLCLDKIWTNIVTVVASVELQKGKYSDEQLASQQKREKLQKDIVYLKKQALAEKQPR